MSQDRPVIYSNMDENPDAEIPIQDSKSDDHSTDQDADFALGDDVALYAEDGDFELEGEERATSSTSESAPIPEPAAADDSASKEQEDQEDSYSIAKSANDDATSDSSSEETKSADSSDNEEAADDHSVATGGEALWEIAKTEQTSKNQQKRTRKPTKTRPGSILVYCPNGHRIEVQERHRGRAGRCPKCKSLFTVPVTKSDQPTGDGEEAKDSTLTAPESHFADLHLHAVDPGKLKLKAGSLAKAFEPVDVCLGKEGMLLLSLSGKGGLFGGGVKPDEFRKELFEYLSLEKGLKKAPGDNKHLFSLDEVKQMAVVHPTAYAHESILGGIDVFGPGLIAIRIPKREDSKLEFLALTLSQFRKFHEQLKQQCDIELEFEADQIPMSDKTTPSLCHYTDQPVKYLNNIVFYENDPTVEIELIGWKCQACGLTLSEDGRKKENIGGKAGKSIAKAKCPKCQNAFGKNPLYALKQEPQAVADEDASEG